MNHTLFRAGDAKRLAAALTAENIPVPEPLAAAVRLAEACDAAKQPASRRALDLDLDAGEHVSYAQRLAVDDNAMLNRLVEIADRGAQEAAAEMQGDGLDGVILALRPKFDEAAAAVTKAAELGITAATTAADIIERDDPRVVDAWRARGPAIATLNKVAALRAMLSETLGVPPTLADVRRAAGSSLDVGAVDFSAAFVAPSAGGFSVDGSAYLGRRPGGGIDWLKLAGSGLRLNTVSEVRQMFADRAATAVNIPLDEDPRAVLGREVRKPDPDDQTVYVTAGRE